MIMIGYSSLIIVGSIELIIFAQCVTQISRLVGTSQKTKEYNTMFVFTIQIRYQIHSNLLIQTSRDQSYLRWTIHEYDEMTNGWWVEGIGVCSAWFNGWWVDGIGVCPVVGYRVMSRGYMSMLTCGLTVDEQRVTEVCSAVG